MDGVKVGWKEVRRGRSRRVKAGWKRRREREEEWKRRERGRMVGWMVEEGR